LRRELWRRYCLEGRFTVGQKLVDGGGNVFRLDLVKAGQAAEVEQWIGHGAVYGASRAAINAMLAQACKA